MSERDGGIVVRGARVHNLRGVDVEIPRGALTVVTGPSGSGKSSLAFDTIYAEAQRRYVESLQTYARQFLEQLPKPDVDSIEGLSPAIALRQEVPARNPRSTVGTATEVHDFLRVLYARVGQPHCPICGRPVHAHTVPQIVDRAMALGEGARLVIQAPVARGVVGDLADELARLRKDGFVRVVIDGVVRELGERIELDTKAAHDLEVQVDRVVVKDGARQRLSDSIELALRIGSGLVRIVPTEGEPLLLSERHVCPVHLVQLPAISPRTFSWNSPEGACPTCGGLGEIERFDRARIVPDASRSIAKGAIAAWGAPREKAYRDRVAALKKTGIDVDTAWSELDETTREAVLSGAELGPKKRIEGVLAALERQWIELDARRADEDDEGLEGIADELSHFRARGVCSSCGGARLRPEALGVTVGGLSIHALEARSIDDARAHVDALVFEGRDADVAAPLLREIRSRLGFLADVGVGYLSLDRSAGTLSTGEAQRIRLATRIGHALVGVLYVLDEPSIGLHPRDTGRLIDTLRALRDRGSTVLVVEHDLDVVRAAERVIDMGPGAGTEGGRVVAVGTPAEIERDERSLTGAFLAGRRRVARPRTPRAPKGWVSVQGATLHNLANVDARVPVGVLTAVTGVSGAGKSSLIVGTLLEAARQHVNGARGEPVRARVEGLDAFDRVIAIDDRPIGRTPRSNPATYAGIFGPIRELFASLPDARARGWDAGRFSFNQKGGRCEACRGEGVVRVDLQFLPDVLATCEVCGGRRYARETLDVRWRGLSIADVLDLTVSQARDVLGAVPQVREKLDAIASVGLGYLALGQSATTLSGGEAQRLALARELSRRATGRTLYVLDEPTTGLHLADVEVLLGVLDELVEQGNTVILIEHALEVVAAADWVIDLGPEGGPGGGRVVATGTPAELARAEGSHTGRLLARSGD